MEAKQSPRRFFLYSRGADLGRNRCNASKPTGSIGSDRRVKMRSKCEERAMFLKKSTLLILGSAFMCLSISALAQSHPAVVTPQGATEQGEAWKGTPPTNMWTGGALLGVGLFDGSAGPTFLGQLAYKINDHGFSPDINNQVFIESNLGVLILTGTSPFLYSVHLRWDFIYDPDLTFFAVGGLAGSVATGSFRLYPRFGVGVFKTLTGSIALRGEISHEWLAGGVSFSF